MPDPAGLGRKVADPLLDRCRTLDDLIETFAGLTESAPAVGAARLAAPGS
jgi:hypothetical protein